MTLKNKNILLAVSGGIAAYKAAEVLRLFQKAGAEVHVLLTKAAQEFITPLTFQALSQNPVHTDLFSLTEESTMSHIQLADQADAMVVVPATADTLAKLALGLADDLLGTAALVTQAPLFVAPAMNVNMWKKPIVQEHLKTLKKRDVLIIEPEEGELACGWVGPGRLAEVEKIVAAVEAHFKKKSQKPNLKNKKVLINAGPTREYLDPARFLSNPSSGRMGYALAQAAQELGAQVTLVSGPVELEAPLGIKIEKVESAQQMLQACQKHFAKSDLFIATAAVADYRPEVFKTKKEKKQTQAKSLKLSPNPDLLKTLSHKKKKGQTLVGFAAETHDLEKNALKKLKYKNLDYIVANTVGGQKNAFQSKFNQAIILSAQGKKKVLKRQSKESMAYEILKNITPHEQPTTNNEQP